MLHIRVKSLPPWECTLIGDNGMNDSDNIAGPMAVGGLKPDSLRFNGGTILSV